MNDWERLGTVSPQELSDARCHLHWASQPLSAAAHALVPKEPDESHTALEWLGEQRWLATALMPSDTPRRVALSLDDLRILVTDVELMELTSLSLEGKTLSDGLEWLGSIFECSLTMPTYDLPPHELQSGASFHRDPEALAEIGRWYQTAAETLGDLDRGPVRLWPHHFDIAILEELGSGKSIGVGMSPGDTSYGEPYWYVSPWPAPTSGEHPALPHGRWHTDGFFSAVLTATELTDTEDRRARLDTFLDAAISSSRAFLADGAS